MKKIVLFITIFITAIFACSGDCTACHPVLKKSIDKSYHVVMKRCIDCHKNSTGGMNECGGDCFSCHSEQKLIKSPLKEHQAIKECSSCHIDRKNLINFGENKFEIFKLP